VPWRHRPNKISSVTAWTGRMTAHIVWDWVAYCSRLVVLRRQRSCLQNCCASYWQRVFECRQNAVVWHGRRRRADSRRPGNPGRCRRKMHRTTINPKIVFRTELRRQRRMLSASDVSIICYINGANAMRYSKCDYCPQEVRTSKSTLVEKSWSRSRV